MKITQKVYLLATPDSLEDGGYRYRISTYEYKDEITISSKEVSIDIPDGLDLSAGHLGMLRAEKQKILADAHVKAENIQDQIQRLLFIEHKEEE